MNSFSISIFKVSLLILEAFTEATLLFKVSLEGCVTQISTPNSNPSFIKEIVVSVSILDWKTHPSEIMLKFLIFIPCTFSDLL